MGLEKCTVRRLKNIAKKKRLIFYGYTQWLNMICNQKGILDSAELIIDDNPYLWGAKVDLSGKSFIVRNPREIIQFLSDDSIIVITAPYQENLYHNLIKILAGRSSEILYCPSIQDRLLTRYRWIFKKMKLKDIIVFRSGLNKYSQPWEYADNARALFEYMLDNGLNEKYKLVWAVKYPKDFKNLTRNKNVKVISYDWEVTANIFLALYYQYYIYRAKYFFFTETCTWLRYSRKEQTLVNLWHGCGIKGRKAKTEPTGTHYDYMTVNSPLYAEIHAKEYGCDIDQMLITGLPKQDWLFMDLPVKLDTLLNLPSSRKYVFWLPTFRMAQKGFEALNEYRIEGETGLPILESLELMDKLDQKLNELDLCLIIKLHPLQSDFRRPNIKYRKIRVLTNDDMIKIGYPINRLLSQADALISDYSSAAIDYLLLDRPMAFTLDDLEEYKESRGFNFEDVHEYLPGVEIYDYEEFENFFIDISNDLDLGKEKREKLINVLHSYKDGKNCERIIKYFKL